MNTKIQAAILYPQLDSEQRKNEEEEEEPSSEPIQTLPLAFFQKKKEKKSKKEGKQLLNFENLAGLGSTLAAQDSCLFFFKEAAFLMNLDIERTEKNSQRVRSGHHRRSFFWSF